MKKNSGERVGEKAIDLRVKSDMQTDAIELEREIHQGTNSKKSYEEEIWTTIDRGLSDSSISGDFFIVVLFKKERHLQNIIRHYFFYRKTCPTPTYDQTVYKYHRHSKEVEYIWTVPDNVTCLNLPLCKHDLPDEHQRLVHMIEAFRCGDLDRYCAKLNNEPIPIYT